MPSKLQSYTQMAEQVARTIRLAMALLGIDVPERM